MSNSSSVTMFVATGQVLWRLPRASRSPVADSEVLEFDIYRRTLFPAAAECCYGLAYEHLRGTPNALRQRLLSHVLLRLLSP